MKSKLAISSLTLSIVLIAPGLLLRFLLENPQKTYNLNFSESIIRESGLPPIISIPAHIATIVLWILIYIVGTNIWKLESSLECKNAVIHLRKKYILLYHLCVCFFSLLILQIPFSFVSLASIEGISFSDIVYSEFPDHVAGLLWLFGTYLMYYDLYRYYQKTPLSVILEHFTEEQASDIYFE